MSRVSSTVAVAAAPGLRLGLAKRSEFGWDLLVRVAGAVQGPALGPAGVGPTPVFFDFPSYSNLQEPATGGYTSRRTRFSREEGAA